MASRSLYGVAKGIDHGTMRGYRQHNHRKVPLCEPCRTACRENARQQYATRADRPDRATAQAWNGGQTGESQPPMAVAPARPACVEPDCGTVAEGHALPDGWLGATVNRVRRRYCSPWCATYAEALADIRSIPAKGDS